MGVLGGSNIISFGGVAEARLALEGPAADALKGPCRRGCPCQLAASWHISNAMWLSSGLCANAAATVNLHLTNSCSQQVDLKILQLKDLEST